MFRPGDRVGRFAFVAAERANHVVARLCRAVGASVSGFYAGLRAVLSVQARAEAEAGLCVAALVMALQHRGPPEGLIHHSDRGVPYAAEPYRRVLERYGVRQSMSRRGNGLDNAPMESFFASLKAEHVHHARFRTRAEARAAVFDDVEVFSNRQRLHSALSYRTPAEARASMEEIAMPAAA